MQLTKDQKRVLGILYKGGTLIRARPGGWWLNDENFDDAGQACGRTCQFLLRHCLIRVMDDADKTYVVFEINSDGKGVYESPDYVPEIDRLDLTPDQRLIQVAWRY